LSEEGAIGDVAVRIKKLRVVEGVAQLRAEFQVGALAQGKGVAARISEVSCAVIMTNALTTG
jgi:hypothetical protein